MCGQGATLRKIKLKLLILLKDLVVNDDSILNDGFYVRKTLSKDTQLIDYILDNLRKANIKNTPEAAIREQTITILYRLNQLEIPELNKQIEEVIQ